MKTLAQKQYEAYGDFVGWKNYAGLLMPLWKDLPEKIQGAWKAASEVKEPSRWDRFLDWLCSF